MNKIAEIYAKADSFSNYATLYAERLAEILQGLNGAALTKASAHSHLLGGKERFKDASPDRFFHSRAIILELYPQMMRFFVQMYGDFRLAVALCGGHGLCGVLHKVQ